MCHTWMIQAARMQNIHSVAKLNTILHFRIQRPLRSLGCALVHFISKNLMYAECFLLLLFFWCQVDPLVLGIWFQQKDLRGDNIYRKAGSRRPSLHPPLAMYGQAHRNVVKPQHSVSLIFNVLQLRRPQSYCSVCQHGQ